MLQAAMLTNSQVLDVRWNDWGCSKTVLVNIYRQFYRHIFARQIFQTLTLVIPIAPIFSLYDVVPLPDPQAPVKKQPNPSIPRPLFIACFGGAGAPEILAHAK